MWEEFTTTPIDIAVAYAEDVLDTFEDDARYLTQRTQRQ